MDTEQIALFRANRALTLLAKQILEILEDFKSEHDLRLNQAAESLIDMEEFLYSKHSVEIDLGHLGKHFEFLNDARFQTARKKILDYANTLKREMGNLN